MFLDLQVRRFSSRSVLARVTTTAFAVCLASAAVGQAPDPHAGHHPGQSTAPSDTSPAALPQAGCADGQMMGCMTGAARKQLYPQLMELPAMTPEARARIEADARTRINGSNAALARAQDDYHRAMINNDAAGMSAAASRQQEAVAQLQSGTAALRALTEGKPPRQIALVWFRDQMNLSSPALPMDDMSGLWGLSWFHILSMTIMAAFVLTMLGFAAARHRRSIALVDRLTATPIASKSAPVPAAANPLPRPVAPAPITVAIARPPSPPSAIWSGTMRVASIVRETPHVKTFRLVEPQGGPVPFTFAPGQFLTFSAEIDGKTVRRSYTIASPPTRTSYVEITVKREDSGEFSCFLHDKVAVGQALQVRGPAGVFTFDGGNADSIVLVAGGVGITPMMCVIRYLTDLSWPGETFLVFATRSTDELIFREELEYLQRRYRRFHVIAAVSERSEGAAWMGLEGQITKDALAHAVPGIDKRRVHLCGPPPMMEAMRKILGELGVPQDQVKTEAFGPATGLVPPPRPQAPPAPPTAVTALLEDVEKETPPVGATEARGPATAMISFARSGKSVPLPPDKSVLEVAESSGVPIDYSCRVGTCGICKTKLLSGEVTMEVQDALSAEDKAGGIILACQAHSLGNVSVDA